uniref:Ig-like domain-containing protein n=1 Tax=Neogobius melanostomus TaxID=47308 RepID=A0A8C6UZB0_9GOBI
MHKLLKLFKLQKLIKLLLSSAASLSVDPHWPQMFSGEQLTLSCEVERSGDYWTYDWSRNNKILTERTREYTFLHVTESDRGDYNCRGVSSYRRTQWSSTTTVNVLSDAASLSVDPHWPRMFSGEQLTLSCEVHRAEYGARMNGVNLDRTSITHKVTSPSETLLPQTQAPTWSRPLTVHVSDSTCPRPLLSASVSWLSPGASVSLSCAVTAPSAGWSYHWYRAVPQSQGYRYELLPEASAGTTQDSFSVQGLTNTAAFVCGAARGTPRFYSEHSDPSFVWSAGTSPNVPLSLTEARLTEHQRPGRLWRAGCLLEVSET